MVKVGPLRQKKLFGAQEKKITNRLEGLGVGEGVMAIVVGPLVEELFSSYFCGFPNV